jgi:hypothetical protein
MSSSSLSSFAILALIAANVLLADVVVAFVPPPTPFGMGRRWHPQNQQSQLHHPGLAPLQSLRSMGAPDDDRIILEDDDDDDEKDDEQEEAEKEEEMEEDSHAQLASSKFQDNDDESSSSSALTTKTNSNSNSNSNSNNVPATAIDWGGALGQLRKRAQDVNSGQASDPPHVLFRTMSLQKPNQIIGKFVTSANPQVAP